MSPMSLLGNSLKDREDDILLQVYVNTDCLTSKFLTLLHQIFFGFRIHLTKANFQMQILRIYVDQVYKLGGCYLRALAAALPDNRLSVVAN